MSNFRNLTNQEHQETPHSPQRMQRFEEERTRENFSLRFSAVSAVQFNIVKVTMEKHEVGGHAFSR
jgi:hypothetical protein